MKIGTGYSIYIKSVLIIDNCCFFHYNVKCKYKIICFFFPVNKKKKTNTDFESVIKYLRQIK